MKTRAVILAGGFGTRIRHLLPDLPKPMAPVCGQPFLTWVIRWLRREGVSEMILSTGHLAEKVADYYASHLPDGISVRCVPETEPLGTGGGFLNCVHACATTTPPPDCWLVTNGDSLTVTPLRELLSTMEDPDVDAAILGLRIEDASRYGSLTIGADGRLLKFAEKKPGSGVINAGVYLFRRGLLERMEARRPLSFETGVFPALLQDPGVRVKAVAVDAPFLDIGTPESLAAAEAFIHSNLESLHL